MLPRVRHYISDLIRKLRLIGRQDDEASVKRLFPLLRQTKHVPGKISWKNASLSYVDAPAVYYQLSDIFIDRVYDFGCDQKAPYILDVGAHIGLASLRLRSLYPDAKITAFEPDPQIITCLRANLASYGDQATQVVEAAAWTKKGSIGFNLTGDDSGGITAQESLTEVPTIDLADYCRQRVDFLKIDIEGAEFDVLQHLRTAGVLQQVQRIFLELHHWDFEQPPRFHEAISTLAEAGFDYRIRTAGLFSADSNAGNYDNYARSSNMVIVCAWRHSAPSPNHAA